MSIQNYTFHIMEAAGAGTKTYYIPFDRLVDVEAVSLVGPVIGAHGSDYITLTVYGNDGATVLCSRNTNSSGTGTDIAEGVSEDLAMSNADKASFSGSQSLKITNVQTGGGKVTNLTLNFKVRDARKF
tara:strand:+ start:1004 stop:1387 length:384 start_codon:yes stop_codon:yes gene_type:complete